MFGHGKRQLLARCRSDGDSSALAESRLHHVILPTVLCVSMFAWTFVQVGLPFYVQGIAGETHATTLRWIGWILGITPILTILTTPMWMRISRHSPMRFYVLMQLLQGSAFVSMALARSLHELFAVRVFLGITGPPTAVAFLIAARSRTSPTTRATSAMQSAMTLGIITGPLAAGTLTARVGYTGSFLIGGMLLVGCAALVGRNAPDARGHDAMARSESARPSIVDIAALCLISLWCRMRTGNGSMGALPVVTVDQARSWVSYWQEMRGVPANSFTLSTIFQADSMFERIREVDE